MKEVRCSVSPPFLFCRYSATSIITQGESYRNEQPFPQPSFTMDCLSTLPVLHLHLP